MIEARGLVRRYGAVIAVDHLSFGVLAAGGRALARRGA
jgi:hypothetical protein